MSHTMRKVIVGIAPLLIGLSLVWAINMTATHIARANPGVLYAKPSASGNNDCSSWDDACTLGDALLTADSGDEIWVAAGTHYPPGISYDATFNLKSGAAVYGGFLGTETSRDDRDWQTNTTVLHGNNTANHVVTAQWADNMTVLDGFTITGGHADVSVSFGAGVYIATNSSPKLINLEISDNHATGNGGGLHNAGSPVLENLTFTSNSANYGGGIYNTGTPTLTNVTFEENSATYGGGMSTYQSSPTLTGVQFITNTATFGGGMYVYSSSHPTLTNVTFQGNTVTQFGGGMHNNINSNPNLSGVVFRNNEAQDDGGGMYNWSNSDPVLLNVTFSENNAEYGGGMWSGDGSDPKLTNVTFSTNVAQYGGGGMFNSISANPTLINVLFTSNTADSFGGGMVNYNNSPTLINVTFSGNHAHDGGGMNNYSNGNPTLFNTILWGNSATNGEQIKNDSSTPNISYSDIDGCGGSGSGWVSACGTDGGGNIDANPLFVDAASGNLRLLLDSPAIDAGDNTAVPSGITTDLDGKARFAEIPEVPDSGNGTPPIVDMGAFEANRVRYAVPSGLESGDCDSWANACALQHALSVTQIDEEIWVATGVYTPGAFLTSTFMLKPGVALYGGFNGDEGDRTLRNWQANPTILSGDIDADDLTDPHGVVTTTENLRGANAYHVVSSDGITESAVLDGFFITAGQANAAGYYYGGGMRNNASNPTLTNLNFCGNQGYYGGGGMANENGSNPALTDVTFSGNYAHFGGGMYNNNSNPTLVSVTFRDNRATSTTSTTRGGGMYNQNSSPILTDSAFYSNTTTHSGGGMCNYSNSNPSLTGVIFAGNTAKAGGGMLNDQNSNPTLVNVTFVGNTADNGGGLFNQQCSPTLTNVSFGHNTATDKGGGMWNYNNNPTLVNSILWGNSAPESPEIFGNSSTLNISYSDIEGCGSSGSGWVSACGTDGGGNIDADPHFVDPTNGYLHLGIGSAAIDVADDTACPISDMDGVARPVGFGCDMGAYEAYKFSIAASKSADDPTPRPGQTITFTIIITNTGPGLSSGLISDTLPSNLYFIGPITLDPPGSGVAGNGTPTLAHSLVISANHWVAATFPISVAHGLSEGTLLTNTAVFTAPLLSAPQSSSIMITVEYDPPVAYLPLIIRNSSP